MRVLVHKIGSVTRNLKLSRELSLAPEIEAREGAVLVGRVLNEKSVYNQLEDIHGRMSTLHAGDLIVGALGHRNALHGYEGVVPSQVRQGEVLNVLNLGGVIGTCVSHNPKVGKPFDVEILGQVQLFPTFQSRVGEPAFVDMGALPRGESLPTCPVIYVAGTCMNSGKTAASCTLVRHLTRAGLRVGVAKLTGVSLLRDVLAMKDYGAAVGYDFTDAGRVSSSPESAPEVSRALFHALAEQRVDAIVVEMGDGILGEYGVQAVLADPALGHLHRGFVLCANDPVGVFGALRLLDERYGIRVDVVSGPATDNRVGTRYIEGQLGVPAINARSQPEQLGEWALSLLRPEERP